MNFFLAAVELGPEPSDLHTFQDEGHQFGAGFFKTYIMDITEEILPLPAGAIVREMTAHTEPEVLGLANIYHFAFIVVEIIHAGCIRQPVDDIFRQMRWQRLLC